MATNLLQLKVVEGNGSLERDVIVSETMTMYNLHRALQFCVKPRQSDKSIDAKAYKFYGGTSRTLIKGPKTAQLYRNNVFRDAEIGNRYEYEFDEGKKARRFVVEIVDASAGDARYDVPRCIGGKDGDQYIDLDQINAKLLVRRFTKSRAGQRKQTQGFWCSAGTTQAELQEAQFGAMQRGLRED